MNTSISEINKKMKTTRLLKMLPVILITAYLLSACGGTLPGNVNTNEAVSTVIAIASSTPIVPVTGATPQSGNEVEIFGVVESMTETAITINGVTYNIVADLTEFNDVISVGDQVKIHVILNADGTFTIREIELSLGDDNGNNNDNTNVNSNDDNGNDNGVNSNDDNNNANSNDDNSNDDDGNNNGGNNNDNDSGGSGSGGNGNDDDGGNNNNSGSNDNG